MRYWNRKETGKNLINTGFRSYDWKVCNIGEL